jgi:hypothetical protein
MTPAVGRGTPAVEATSEQFVSHGGLISLTLIGMSKTNSTDDARLAAPTPEDVLRLNAFWRAFADSPTRLETSPRDRMDAWVIEQRMIADRRANAKMTKATWWLVLATIALFCATVSQVALPCLK